MVKINNKVEFINAKIEKEIEIENNRSFRGELVIEDYSELENLYLRDVRKVDKITLKNLPKLQECTIWKCDTNDLVVDNCLQINKLNVRQNNLTNLEFIKDLENLEELEIEGNPKLIEILEPYDDWKDHQKDLQESNKDTLELLKNIRVLEKEKKSLNIKYTELKKFLKEKTFILLSRDAKQELVNKLDKEFREKENLLLIPGKTKELMLSTEEAIKSVKEIKKDLEEELDKSKTKIKELEKRLKEFREKDTYYQELKKSVEQKKKELEELKNVVITNNQLKEDDLDDILEAQERGDYKKLKRARRNLMMFAQRISEQEINNLCQLQKVIVELEVELGETEKKQIYQININGGYNINNFGSKFYDSSFGGNINAEQQGIENLIAQIESLPKN